MVVTVSGTPRSRAVAGRGGGGVVLHTRKDVVGHVFVGIGPAGRGFLLVRPGAVSVADAVQMSDIHWVERWWCVIENYRNCKVLGAMHCPTGWCVGV